MNSGLYIHIPFCKAKCLYCDFNSFAGREECMAPYFCALDREVEAWSKKLSGKTFDTVYFGGGTPSYAGADFLCGVIASLKNKFDIDKNAEITVECNPGTIGSDGFETLRQGGANRLSIGLQSTDNKMLRKLGRIHTAEDFKTCFDAARHAGFDNISLDLMYGLPDMTMEDWKRTLEKALAFDAEHISVYALKVEEGTPFSKMKLVLPNDDLTADMYERAVEVFRSAGYKRYEISNFAKKGFESRHNQKYWRLDDFLGLGAGAYSCIDGVRFSNEPDISAYIEKTEQTGFSVCEEETLSLDEQMSEFVFLGLRCEDGISILEFEKRFDRSILDVFGEPIKKYTNYGFLVLEGDNLRFSDKGFFVSNQILADFV